MGTPVGFVGPFEDRLAIRELNDSYADVVIRQDIAAFATLWEPDAVWTHGEVGDGVGVEAISAIFAGAFRAFPMVIMTCTLGQLTVRGDGAEGRLYIDELVHDDQGASWRVKGVYADRYAKRGGQWRFARRDYTLIHRERTGP